MLPGGSDDVPVLLDGGLSTALEQQGVDLGGALWTARLLGEAPERIARAHRAYVEAGARVATTASYQASVEGLVAAGYDAAEARRLITRSVTVAREVRDELADTHPGLLVAASVGPYGAFLADGSEYTGRYGVSAARLRDFHGPRLELLAAAGPDLFAVETIPDADEAEVLVALLDELDVPAWFSYSVRGATTSAGQPLAEAYAVLAGSRSVVAAGVTAPTRPTSSARCGPRWPRRGCPRWPTRTAAAAGTARPRRGTYAGPARPRPRRGLGRGRRPVHRRLLRHRPGRHRAASPNACRGSTRRASGLTRRRSAAPRRRRRARAPPACVRRP